MTSTFLPRLLASALLAAAALAQAEPSAGAYAGLAGGQSQHDIDCGGTTSCDDTGRAYKAYLGWEVNENMAVEAAYYRIGKARTIATDPLLGEVDGELRGQGPGLFGLFLAPYSKHFKLFGKFGFVNMRVTLETRSSAGTASRSERHTNPAWGIGAQYDFSDMLGLRLEYERARVKFLDAKRDVDMVTAGLTLHF